MSDRSSAWTRFQARKPTSRRRRLEELQQAETLFRAIFESAAIGIVLADAEGRPHECNPAFERMFGYTEDELRTMRVSDFMHPDDAEETERALQALIEGKLNRVHTEKRCIRKDGGLVWVHVIASTVVDPNGEPAFTIAMIEDISARKSTEADAELTRDYLADLSERPRMEEELAQERHLMNTFLEATSQVYFKDRASRFTRISKLQASKLGLNSPDEGIGKTDFDFFSEEHARQAYEDEQRIIRTGEPLVDIEERETWEDGREDWVSTTKMPLHDESGAIIGTYGISHDITERKRAEEERRLLEAELLQSQKMEAVGRLAGGVAHNFNNLLTAIIGYSELLLARLPADSELRPDVEEIRQASERAAEVARQLLLFSRRERGQRERLDLNDAIREMGTLLRQLIRSDIEIATVLADDLDRIESDRSQIEQVLVNLVVNASDAMPDGGKLAIETANLHLAEPRFVRDVSLLAGNYVTLTVRDSGHGMDEETRARVFEPFFTTKGPDRGTGLGLSTVYGIVEENEGYIFVESELDQGSTFTIFLPAGES